MERNRYCYTGWTKIATIKGDSTISYNDEDVIVNKQYYYTIRAFKLYNGKIYKSTRKAQGIPGKAEPLVPEVTPVTFRENNIVSIYDQLTSVGLSNIVNTDRTMFTPQKGDIVIFLWKDDEGKYNWSHIGIATDLRGNYLYTVEGNTSNNITAFDNDNYDKLVVADCKRLYLSDNSAIVGILRMK